ncbi:MAG: hypothetical protein OHK0039_13780 [Bacteroidia bacterium]
MKISVVPNKRSLLPAGQVQGPVAIVPLLAVDHLTRISISGESGRRLRGLPSKRRLYLPGASIW